MWITSNKGHGSLLGSVSILPFVLFAGATHANPTGGSVEAGSASIETVSPSTLQVNQTSDKAIINWQSFDIGNGETTRFALPNAGSVTLNRDFSGDPSEILGNLESNGQFFLVNRSGILFGPNSRIDVAGMVATTHDIASDDFMAGNLGFSISGDAGASVINQGQISVDDLGFGAFVAPHVRNDGAIIANMGKVELASASGFTLDLHGDRLISFLVENPNELELFGPDGQPITALVENSGSIIADGGQVALTASAARGVVDSVINTDGIIQANTVEQRNGKIILGGGITGVVKTSGQISAKGDDAGETGGIIIATGEYLLADEFARIDVSGWSGGGRLMFGGDYLGGDTTNEEIVNLGIILEDEPIQTASVAVVDFGAEMSVDALVEGDGGKLIAWGDEALFMAGALSAKGGEVSGDGGFVETSGKYLEAPGSVEISAVNGSGGTWLLDPLDITIDDSNGGDCRCTVFTRDFGTREGGFFTALTFAATDQDSVIEAETIEYALNQGGTVVVTTFGTFGDDAGDITLKTAIEKIANVYSELRLLADDDIYIDDGVDIRDLSSGDLLLELFAGGDDIRADNIGTLDLNDGNLILQAADDIRFETNSDMPTNVTLITLNRDTTAGVVDTRFGSDVVRYSFDDQTATIQSGGIRLLDPNGGNVILVFDRDVFLELNNYSVEMDLSRGRDLGIGENSVIGMGTDYDDAVDGIPEIVVNGGIGEVIDFFNPNEVSNGVFDILYAYDWYAGTDTSPIIEGSLEFDADIDFFVVTIPSAAPEVDEIVETPVQSPIEQVVQEIDSSQNEIVVPNESAETLPPTPTEIGQRRAFVEGNHPEFYSLFLSALGQESLDRWIAAANPEWFYNELTWESIEVAAKLLFDPRVQKFFEELGFNYSTFSTSFFLEFDWSEFGLDAGKGLVQDLIFNEFIDIASQWAGENIPLMPEDVARALLEEGLFIAKANAKVGQGDLVGAALDGMQSLLRSKDKAEQIGIVLAEIEATKRSFYQGAGLAIESSVELLLLAEEYRQAGDDAKSSELLRLADETVAFNVESVPNAWWNVTSEARKIGVMIELAYQARKAEISGDTTTAVASVAQIDAIVSEHYSNLFEEVVRDDDLRDAARLILLMTGLAVYSA